MRLFRILVTLTAGAVFALVVLGGVVRVTGSGLGCPDWPLCHGRLIPPLEGPALIEYSHRLVAASVSFLVLATAAVAWWYHRRERWIVIPATGALGLLVVQVIVGGLTVIWELPPTIVLVHLANAMALFALLLIPVTVTWYGPPVTAVPSGPLVPAAHRDRYPRLVLTTAAAAYVLILTGAYVVGTGAGLACPDFPLCLGQVLPPGHAQGIQMLHRFTAAAVAVLLMVTIVHTWRRRERFPGLMGVASLAGGLFMVQVSVGIAQVKLGLPLELRALHLATATAIWGSLVVLTLMAYGSRKAAVVIPRSITGVGQRSPQPSTTIARTQSLFAPLLASPFSVRSELSPVAAVALRQPASSLWKRYVAGSEHLIALVSDYLALTKPWIIVLLLITALAAMLVASPGMPPLSLVVFTLLGGAMAAGGAGAVNSYLDRDMDGMMARTRHRPLPSRRIAPRSALIFGLALGVLAVFLMVLFVNLLSAALTILGFLYYVLVYTRWLKRSTPQNIVIGGAAGAMPPLVGWAAVTGQLSLLPLYLFVIIFFWTPPHFWALSLLMHDDYQAAGVPMLPVVRGEAETRRQILLYAVGLVVLTLLLTPLGLMGGLYFGAAVLLGAQFLLHALRLWRDGSQRCALRLYKYSILYLALLFGAMVLDHIVRVWFVR